MKKCIYRTSIAIFKTCL